MTFSISVIIPVYNSERFIEKAVNSALNQSEVSEIVVINDGSTDSTNNILENLKKSDTRIKILHHENNKNKGRSASRNLGIKKASGNYIAFLDADDFYLENRFKNDNIIFDNEEVDGVYNAIGAHFYRTAKPEEKRKLELTTVFEAIEPDELFETLLYYKKGHFSIDGLTVKKSIFNEIGYFDETLKVSEDTHLILKMALKCCLKSGIIDAPLAMRGVHDTNIFNQEHLYEAQKLEVYESLLFWATENNVALNKIDHILNILWIFRYKKNHNLFKNIGYWFYVFFKAQKLLFTTLSIKYFPVVRLRQKLFPFLYKH